MQLEGERVRLRPADTEDLPAYVRWYAAPEFRRLMGRGDDVIAGLAASRPDRVNYSAETKDGRLIGLVVIARIRTVNRSCELTDVGIGERDCWDLGYGTEIMKLALRFCFRDLSMRQAHIVTAEFNERARRCYGRLFPFEQRRRQRVWEDGRFWDEIYFDITEEEFDALDPA